MQRDDIRGAQQLVDRHVTHPGGAAVLLRERVKRQHRAAESLQDAGDYGADPAGADHTRRPAIHVEAEQPLEGEVPFTHAIKSAVQLAIERQHQAHGVLRHRVRRVGRHARDCHPEPLRCRDIHVIEAGTAERHQPHATCGEQLQHGRVEAIIDECADRVVPVRERRRRFIQVRLQEVQLVAAGIRLLQRGAVVLLRAENGDLHLRVL
ncbi:hypothetical protein BH20VER2_BH20VER2_03580 [soil metagenome]